MAHLGIREIIKDVWGPNSTLGQRSGVFPNFARATEPTVCPDGTALSDGLIYYNTTDDIWYGRTNGAWTSISASGSSPSMQTAYNNGETVTIATNHPITLTDAQTGATNSFVINKTAAGSGNLIDLNYTAADDGDALNITMTSAGTAAQALTIASQAATRITNPLVDISELGTGAVPTLEVSGDAATTGALLRLNASAAVAPVAGTDGMMTVLMTNAANGTEGIFISNLTTTRTGACLGISDAGTTTGPLIRLVQTGTSSGNAIAYTTSGAVTGDAVNLTMTNAGTAAQALVVVGQAGAATSKLVSISPTGTGNAHTGLTIVAAGALSGTGGANLELTASAATAGDFMLITMTNAGNGADGIVMTGSPTGRTGTMLAITDAQTTGNGGTVSITKSGASAVGDVIDVTCSNTGAGAVFDIDLTAAYTGIVFDIDGTTGVHTGDIFNFNTTQAYAGDVFDITLTNCAAGVQALVITGSATTRTAHLIEIAEVGTPSGDVINVSYSGAATGDMIHFVGTNAVAARALNLDGAGTRTANLIDIDTTGSDTVACVDIATTAVGASGVPAALNIATSGVLVAGADSVRLLATGNMSSTSSVLSVEYTTGTAPTQGVVYISCASAGDLALKVDSGTVAFDEGISGAVIGATGQTVAAGGTSTALTVGAFWHHIDADAGGDTFTLADGTIGQIKVISLLSATGVATVTPANMAGGTSVTMNAAGETVLLVFQATEWYVLGGNGYTIV